MGKALRRLKRLSAFLQTAGRSWGSRCSCSCCGRRISHRFRGPRPAHGPAGARSSRRCRRLWRGCMARRSLSRARAAARALAALCLLSTKAVSGQDDHHRQRRPARDLAISRGLRKIAVSADRSRSSCWAVPRSGDSARATTRRSLVAGSLARRKRVACRAQESGGDRLCEHAGSDRARPGNFRPDTGLIS